MLNWLPILVLLIVQGSAAPDAAHHRADLARFLVFTQSVRSADTAKTSRPAPACHQLVPAQPPQTAQDQAPRGPSPTLTASAGLLTVRTPRDGPQRPA